MSIISYPGLGGAELTQEQISDIASKMGFSLIPKSEHALREPCYTYLKTGNFVSQTKLVSWLCSDAFFKMMINELNIEFKFVSDATVSCYAILLEKTVTSSINYHHSLIELILSLGDEIIIADFRSYITLPPELTTRPLTEKLLDDATHALISHLNSQGISLTNDQQDTLNDTLNSFLKDTCKMSVGTGFKTN
tara:strand:- start:81 stop:659 length:579 start_codon:yes stop_codon:yes gene_type:complete